MCEYTYAPDKHIWLMSWEEFENNIFFIPRLVTYCCISCETKFPVAKLADVVTKVLDILVSEYQEYT